MGVAMTCVNCGSDYAGSFSAELSYSTQQLTGVYSLQMGSFCFACGASKSFVSSAVLNQLRTDVGTGTACEDTKAKSLGCNCKVSHFVAFEADITFGRGLRPPVPITAPVNVLVCLGCGRSTFSVAGDPLGQLRDGAPAQPLVPSIAWRRLARSA